ncbi:hypothetical protein TEQG_07567 [Trichophyton equinum CBS 127.97]|uniref:Uncharacterized protein n=1 Tax=Trichophyton equinum (strain ATCC MYA-4606 / CBS 127.97) TaxID=559882 RepID=F2Q333_TRIEC|nr:hypothetical protein TEQG_07567 [Trichophyton equinum CBS 127.97]
MTWGETIRQPVEGEVGKTETVEARRPRGSGEKALITMSGSASGSILDEVIKRMKNKKIYRPSGPMSDSFPACELCLFVCQPARQLRPPSRRATAYRSGIADYTSHALVTLRNEVSEVTKQKAKKSNFFLDSGAVSVTSAN